MSASYLKGLDREILDYLKNAPPEFLKCRVRGHDWDPTHDGYIVQEEGVHVGCLTERLQCSRCHSGGLDTFDRTTLERVCPREYTHTDGYLQQGLAIPRTVVRRYLAQQALEQQAKSKAVRKIATRSTRKSPAAKAA